MRFKISFSKVAQHSDTVCCVAWNTTEEIFSCGDDHALFKWNLVTNEAAKMCELPADVYPTDLHSFSRHQGSTKKLGHDQLLITSADGRYHLIGRNGRLEKSVEAHKGAALVGRYSPDGAGLLTAGEDGQVKVWSRSGMLRSTVIQASAPVYSAVWSPDSNHVLYTNGKMLVIKALAPNTKPNRWKAHEGLILKVVWNSSNNFIVSGGEDCRYKVWDEYGRQLFMSMLHDYPITALAWSPSGDFFAVGSFNTLRLCDKAGWSYSLEKPATGSMYSIAWSSDGTQVAAACANGQVLLGHIIERRLEWRQLEVVITGRKCVSVRDVGSEAREQLELPERVIQLALGQCHLVVTTPTQCYVYATTSFNTPLILELREGAVTMVLLADSHFLLVERSSLSLYSYEGRLLLTPKWPTMQPEAISQALISLSPDTLAVRDAADEKLVHLIELSGGTTSPFQHSAKVSEVALSQAGLLSERLLAIVDTNGDLFLATVAPRLGLARKVDKLGVLLHSLQWNSSCNMLAGMQDTALTVWYYPAVLFTDQRLTRRTIAMKDASEFGKNPSVVSFDGSHISVRRSDGALINTCVSPYVRILHGYAASACWQDALRLCRAVKDNMLWACVAAMAAQSKELDAAEEAYAAIDQVEKVAYIQHIKSLPVRAAQLAEMALLGGNVQDAELLLLQNGLVFRAIVTNLHTHNWNRALELAVKHKSHLDIVLFYRQKYLDSFEKSETNEMFLQFKDGVDIDEDRIQKKIALQYQNERTKEHLRSD